MIDGTPLPDRGGSRERVIAPATPTDEQLAIVAAAIKWAEAAWWGPTSDVLHKAENDLLAAVMAQTAARIAAGEATDV